MDLNFTSGFTEISVKAQFWHAGHEEVYMSSTDIDHFHMAAILLLFPGHFDTVAKPWYYNFRVRHVMLCGPKRLFLIHLHGERGL